jgi:hypothetical protein
VKSLAAFNAPPVFADFAPLAERATVIDEVATIRFRGEPGRLSGFVRLPYGVLAGRTIAAAITETFDVTVSAEAFRQWVDENGPEPERRDAHWLTPLPPAVGWTRIDRVPDQILRDLIRTGAEVATAGTSRAQQESLLSSIVLTVTGSGNTIEVPLGPVTALTRMGFLPRDSEVGIDVAAGWIRIAAPFGSTYVAPGPTALGTITLLR